MLTKPPRERVSLYAKYKLLSSVVISKNFLMVRRVWLNTETASSSFSQTPDFLSLCKTIFHWLLLNWNLITMTTKWKSPPPICVAQITVRLLLNVWLTVKNGHSAEHPVRLANTCGANVLTHRPFVVHRWRYVHKCRFAACHHTKGKWVCTYVHMYRRHMYSDLWQQSSTDCGERLSRTTAAWHDTTPPQLHKVTHSFPGSQCYNIYDSYIDRNVKEHNNRKLKGTPADVHKQKPGAISSILKAKNKICLRNQIWPYGRERAKNTHWNSRKYFRT